MRRFMVWWQYLQKPTLVLGAVLGALLVTACMYFIERQWYIDFQPTIAAGIAIIAAVWTINLTILHRNEDNYRQDQEALETLWCELQKGIAEPNFLERVKIPSLSIPSLPSAVRIYIHQLTIVSLEIEALTNYHFPSGPNETSLYYTVGQKMSELIQWFSDCRRDGRYLPFKTDGNLEGLCNDLESLRRSKSSER